MEDELERDYTPDYIRQMVSRLQLKELHRILMSIDHDVWGSQDDLRRRIMDSLSFRVTSSQTLEQTIIQVYKQAKIQEPLLQSPNVQSRNNFPHHQLLSHSKVSTSFQDKREIDYPRSLPFYEIKKTLIEPFCHKEPVTLHDEVYLPCDLKVVLNNKECVLPHYTLSKINANERQRRISVPINLNKYIKFNCRAENKLTITCSDPDIYMVGVFLAEKLTCEEQIEKLRKRPYRTIETSKEFIKNLMDKKADIIVDSMVVVTLNDPLTKTRMTLPARGVECIHIQCFDAMEFLKMNENMQTWKCPICRSKVRFENIEIDGYFLNIIQNGTWVEKKPYNNNNSDDEENHLKLKRLKYNPGKEFCENYNAIINPTFNNNKL
ncbi:hypothetical protein AGLY_003466 [Aphis glycines]|uniref:SP-RING-type domain-containing protein n=1 Tax=Aphis glycines TaxID=307491 RepID=A0A6G0U138_APHGL|nr:hypothetical protein AGLY_003466 [Aphis glycines]